MRWPSTAAVGGRGDTMHILFVLATWSDCTFSTPLESGMIMGVCLGTEMGVDYFTF